MSAVLSGNFPFQTSSQDAYSNYENPAFRIRVRDIRDTGLPAVDGSNDVDYSHIFKVGDDVVGQSSEKTTEEIFKGKIEEIKNDDKGNPTIIVIRTIDNEKMNLDPDTVVKVKDGSNYDRMDMITKYDNFFVPGPSKEMSEPRKLMAESQKQTYIKSFKEYIDGM